jgi:hypothetical protein
MKPVCVPCQRFFRPSRNGFPFIEGMPIVNGAQPGVSEPQHWRPYKLWMGDKWECPDCHAEIIVGAPLNPISEHYMDDFTKQVDTFNPTLQVNDC